MNLDDALSCGRIVKVVVKEGYTTLEEGASSTDVRYGVSLSFKNLNGTKASDVGIRLENLKREQQFLIETKESPSADVGLIVKWRGLTNSNIVAEVDVVEFTTRESIEGYSAVFDKKAKVERGRFIDFLPGSDKIDISPLSTYDADNITLYLQPKRYKDVKKPTEELIGLFHDEVSPLISTEGGGISSNAVLAALVTSVQEIKSLMSQLYAKRIVSYSYMYEKTFAIITKIGLGNLESHGQEFTNVIVGKYNFEAEGGQTQELHTSIVTVGTVGSNIQNSEINEIVVPYIQ